MIRDICLWIVRIASCICFAWASAATAQVSTGVWWSPAEPGRGYVVEVNGLRAMWAVLGYRSGGSAGWYTSTGALFTSNVYIGSLTEFGGGQTLSGSAQSPTSSVASGNLSFTSTSSTQGVLILPGERQLTLQRFEFVGGGVAAGRPAAAPEIGWWWNPSEPGTGYFFEVQGARLFAILMMYGADGTSRWYSATGDLTIGAFGLTPTTTATLEEYAGGPTLSGAYTSAARSGLHGQITLAFSSTTAGVITLPNGRSVALSRFSGF